MKIVNGQTQWPSRILSHRLANWPCSDFAAPERFLPYTTQVKMCIRLESLRSIAGLPDKYDPWNELYVVFSVTGTRTRGHSTKLFPILRPTRDVAKSDFVERASKIWNSLPASIIHAPSLSSFKRSIRAFDFSAVVISRIRL